MEGMNLAIAYNYIYQALFGLALFFLLLKFYRQYNSNAQFFWSLGFLSFSLNYIFSFLVLQLLFGNIQNYQLFEGNSTFSIRTLFSVLSVSSSILTGAFFLFASRSGAADRKIIFKRILYLFLFAILLTFLIVLPASNTPESGHVRIFLRVGVTSAISGSLYLASGLTIYLKSRLRKSFGSRIVSIMLIAFALIQFYLFSLRIISFYDAKYLIGQNDYMLDMSEFMIHSLFGIALIIWMLEIEQNKLRLANEKLDNFLYSTSHDLRAPIASVLGLLNIFKLEERAEEKDKYVDLIEGRMKKLDEVIHDILNYSKSSRLEPKLELVNIHSIIDESINNLKFLPQYEKLRIEYEKKEEEWLIWTDRSLMMIILQNLLQNAVNYHDYTKYDPFVKVSVLHSGRILQLIIQDNGVGIEKEYHNKIFNMFFRANDKIQGTGLGLHIVMQCVKKLDGEIEMDSTSGIGTEFRLIFTSKK